MCCRIIPPLQKGSSAPCPRTPLEKGAAPSSSCCCWTSSSQASPWHVSNIVNSVLICTAGYQGSCMRLLTASLLLSTWPATVCTGTGGSLSWAAASGQLRWALTARLRVPEESTPLDNWNLQKWLRLKYTQQLSSTSVHEPSNVPNLTRLVGARGRHLKDIFWEERKKESTATSVISFRWQSYCHKKKKKLGSCSSSKY